MKKKPDERTERLIKDAKCRGGRGGQVMKDKTKYDRKEDKKKTKREVDKWKED